MRWFENHSMIYLENKFINNGERGLDLAKNELQNLIFFGMTKDEWDGSFGWKNWIDNQVNEAIFNATLPYIQIYGEGLSNSTGGKPEVLEKLENWKKGIVVAKGTRMRHVLPAFIDG